MTLTPHILLQLLQPQILYRLVIKNHRIFCNFSTLVFLVNFFELVFNFFLDIEKVKAEVVDGSLLLGYFEPQKSNRTTVIRSL